MSSKELFGDLQSDMQSLLSCPPTPAAFDPRKTSKRGEEIKLTPLILGYWFVNIAKICGLRDLGKLAKK